MVKKLSDECNKTFATIEKVCSLDDKAKNYMSLLISLISTGDISEHYACFAMGLVVGNGEQAIKEYVEKVKALKKEVN